MPKLTDKQKKKIIADYVDNGNYSETGRINNVSDMTVRRLVEKDKDVLRKVEEKKLENTQTTIEYMESQHQTKKQILDNLLNAINEKSTNVDMFTNVKDLATAYGIILDKELKLAEIRMRNKIGDNNDINNQIQNIANLINSPAKVRTEGSVEDGDVNE